MLAEVIGSRISFEAPLVPAFIVAALSFRNPIIFENPNLLGHFVESIFLGYMTYCCTFLAQLLVLLPLSSNHSVQRCLAPQGSKVLDYYAEKKSR